MKVSHSTLRGHIDAPPSKAHTHRAVIAAALSDGHSIITEPLTSEDTLTTVEAVRSFGAKVAIRRNWTVQGNGGVGTPSQVIDCRESAATMRFITPIMSHAPGIAILTGAETLARRPQKPLLNALRQLGVKCYSTGGNGKPPLVIFGGGIRGGKARIKGDISSQYVTGLLFAAPCADNDVEIEVAGRLESKPYVDITLAILHKHGIRVSHDDTYGRFTIPHDQKYKPSNHLIEGDYSSAAFLLAAAAVTDSRVLVRNLREDSIQGDKEIVQILREMSAKVTQTGSYVEVGGRVHAGIEVDATDIPDLVPVVAVLGCFAKGETVLKNVQRLRLKESDRVRSLTSELQKMGVRSRVRNGDLSIRRATSLQHSHFDAHDDHRIAMACSVAALGIRGSSTISNAEVVAKSYPRFFEDLKRLGGKIDGA